MNKKLDKYAYTEQQLNKAFADCFSTPMGKMVLDRLKEEYYDCVMTPGPGVEFRLGCRHIIFEILERMNQV